MTNFTKIVCKNEHEGQEFYGYYDVEFAYATAEEILEYYELNPDSFKYVLGSAKLERSSAYTPDNLFFEYNVLSDDETYIVAYYVDHVGWTEHNIDHCVTKEEIINNVMAGKYGEFAQYWTMGQAMRSTMEFRKELEECKKRKSITVQEMIDEIGAIIDNVGLEHNFSQDTLNILEAAVDKLETIKE